MDVVNIADAVVCNSTIKYTTECCKQKVCWLRYNSEAINRDIKCNDCGALICHINCKPVEIAYGGPGYLYHLTVCPGCCAKGMANGKYTTTKNYSDIDVWLG